MIAVGKNKEYTISVCVGAAVNFVLNLILIPKYSALGAVIATVSAESTIALIQLWYSREIVDVSWIKETYIYWVAGILMLVLVSLMGEGTQRNFIILAKQIVTGIVVYFGSLIMLRDKMLKNSFNVVKEMLKKNK